MTNERDFQEATARCVSIAVYYHNTRDDRDGARVFRDDVRSVARWFEETGLGDLEADHRVLGPLYGELVARYGIESVPISAPPSSGSIATPRVSERPSRPGPSGRPFGLNRKGTLRERPEMGGSPPRHAGA